MRFILKSTVPLGILTSFASLVMFLGPCLAKPSRISTSTVSSLVCTLITTLACLDCFISFTARLDYQPLLQE